MIAVAVPGKPVVPTLEQLHEMLRELVRVRQGNCSKCLVARDPTRAVDRLNFPKQGGHGKGMNALLKKVCPLAQHALDGSADGPLVAMVTERFPALKPLYISKELLRFMADEHGVEPLGGKTTYYKVRMYVPQRADLDSDSGGCEDERPLEAHPKVMYKMYQGFEVSTTTPGRCV